MNQLAIKNKIQGLGDKAIMGGSCVLKQKSYSPNDVHRIIGELKINQGSLFAELLRATEFEDKQENETLDLVRQIKRAWFIKGKNPEYHDRTKFRLYKSWRPLHDAIERLANY